MDMPLTRDFLQKLPNDKKTDKVKDALKAAIKIGPDHFVLISVSATAGLLSHAIMQQAITSWALYLKMDAATYKLANFLEDHALKLSDACDTTPTEISFAKSIASMLLIEKRLIEHSGRLTDETMHALEISWKLEIIRLIGTDDEFDAIKNDWEEAWATVETVTQME